MVQFVSLAVIFGLYKVGTFLSCLPSTGAILATRGSTKVNDDFVRVTALPYDRPRTDVYSHVRLRG